GPLKIYKEVTSGRGFGSSDPPTLHFGLGKNTRIEQLRVRWPDGSSADYPPPPVDGRIRIRKGESSWTRPAAPRCSAARPAFQGSARCWRGWPSSHRAAAAPCRTTSPL